MTERAADYRIRSMTAFASTELRIEGVRLGWDLRAVNHRFLDVVLRVPDLARSLEADFRLKIQEHIKRGRIEAQLTIRKEETAPIRPTLNEPLLETLTETLCRLDQIYPERFAPTMGIEILRWPGVFSDPELDTKTVLAAALQLLDEATASLQAARCREGQAIARLIFERCDQIQQQTQRARDRFPSVTDQFRHRLLARMDELGASADPFRLEQEVLYYLQKMDICEELDRLDLHCQEIQRLLEAAEPNGRRLDFLAQEINREANTLGSKSQDIELTRVSVDIKVLMEQIKEQVQNIE